jgi:hypothetical protein
MSLTRRNFIRIAGSAAIITASGLTTTACDTMPDSAIAPWQGPDPSESDPRVAALSYAVLAPNPHNMQPWLVDISRPDEVMLYCDGARLLPETDPFFRQIMIGHGTFLELLDLAAAAQGYRTEVSYFPQGEFAEAAIDGRPVARIHFVAATDPQADPLFAEIRHRRSNKEPYDATKPLLAEHAAALSSDIGDECCGVTLTTDVALVGRLRDLTWAAMEIEIRTPRTFRESIDRMRLGADEIAASPDGIDVHGTMIWWGKRLGFVSRESLADPESSAFQMGLDMQRELSYTAMAFAWLTTPDNSRTSQVEAGRAYARLNLLATQLGVAMHPMSQLLQEYPEMADKQGQFLEAVGAEPGATVQMLARLGYGEAPGPSPRRRLADITMA